MVGIVTAELHWSACIQAQAQQKEECQIGSLPVSTPFSPLYAEHVQFMEGRAGFIMDETHQEGKEQKKKKRFETK